VADDDAYNDFSHDPLNAAREALINDVAVFAHTRYKATVVFDGGGNPSSTGQRSEVAGVGVIFSAAGTCADATIEELARSAASSERNVLVVSSDATIQWTVLGPRVTRMSAMGFADEMRAIKKVAAYELEAVTVKNTLAERLDPKVREQLSNMVRKRT
jgi:predicted RNA-binding protein with PIN domain